MKAFFSTDGDVVVILMRAESGEGSQAAIGDLVAEVAEDGEFAGIPYADLAQSKAGEIAFDDEGRGKIVAKAD